MCRLEAGRVCVYRLCVCSLFGQVEYKDVCECVSVNHSVSQQFSPTFLGLERSVFVRKYPGYIRVLVGIQVDVFIIDSVGSVQLCKW